MKKIFTSFMMFALVCLAQAQIVYTDLESSPVVMDQAYVMNDELGYEMNLAGITGVFYIQNYAVLGYGPSYFACFETGSKVVGSEQSDLYAIAITPLPANTTIDASSNLNGPSYYPGFPVIYDNTRYTAWAGQTAYVGFSFQKNGSTHYGWAKLAVSSDAVITLYGFAYQNTPNTAIVTGDKGTGINNVSMNALHAFPVPAKDVLHIQGIDGMQDVVVTDMTGRAVMSATTEGDLNIANLAKGVYILKTGSCSIKFVKE